MKKNAVRKWIIILVLILAIIGIFYYFVPKIYLYYESWRIGKNYREFEKSYLDFLKNDKFGGETPQETYELYVSALKKGDVDLAVKYYWWEKQEKEKERLEKTKSEGKMEEYANNFPTWSELKEEEYWDPNGKRYSWIKILKEPVKINLPLGNGKYQEDVLDPGEYKQEITFWFNSHSNVWKLY